MSSKNLNTGLCILVAVLWGILGLFIKLLDPIIQPTYQVTVRYVLSLISFIIIMTISWIYGAKGLGTYYITHLSYLRIGRLAFSNIVVIILASIFGFGISIPAFFIAVSICGVYFTYIVGIGLTVIVTALMKVLSGSEIFTKYKLGYIILLLTIIVVTTYISKISYTGLIYVIIFSITWGLYLWLVGNINRPGRDFISKLYTTCIDMSISLAIGLISLIAFFHIGLGHVFRSILRSLSNIYTIFLMVIGIVLLCTVLPYIIICIVLSMDPTLVVNFSIIQYLEVILALLLGIFYFHELPINNITIMYIIFSIVSLVLCMYLRALDIGKR